MLQAEATAGNCPKVGNNSAFQGIEEDESVQSIVCVIGRGRNGKRLSRSQVL